MRYLLFITFSLALFSQSLTAQVKTGIEVLKESGFAALKGKRVGLLTNPTGVDNNLKSTVDILFEAKGVNLTALFAPEHGVRGNEYAGAKFANSKDKRTGLPVFSLHGKTKKPTAEMLKNVDVIVYDIQDIGCRSYTFISSLGLLMEAAAENGKEVVVLDRPNPLGGEKVEGPIVEPKYTSFISQFPIPYIYGLTCGELATMLNEEGMTAKKCSLTVVKMEGWKRDMTYKETGLKWVLTSPHIPNMNTSFYYPLSGIVGELSVLSVGVGYTMPFELFGASWANADTLASAMNALKLDGLLFRPIVYKPYYAFGKGELLQGVQVYITDFEKAKLTEVQFYVLQELKKLYPQKDFFTLSGQKNCRSFDYVCGSGQVRSLFSKNYQFKDVEKFWRKDNEAFKSKSKKYWLYK